MTNEELLQLKWDISCMFLRSSKTQIDLILKLFGFEPIEEKEVKNKQYVDQILNNQQDLDKLKDLANYLGITENDYKDRSNLDLKKEVFKLFISHSSIDSQLAEQLQSELEKYKLSVFVAHTQIEPTEEWQRQIEESLFNCSALVAILTQNFHQSYWTDQEIGVAYGKGILIIPLSLGVNPYGFIGKYQGLQATNKPYSNVAEEIIDILLKNSSTKDKIKSSIIETFINVNSYSEARYYIDLLEKVETFDELLLKKLAVSLVRNRQIYEENQNNVPNRVYKLIEKMSKNHYTIKDITL